jgi:peptidoglycan biosynthesis protein MviN/MurJ (putative lipid II flippase)
MPNIIKEKKDIFVRFPIGAVLVILAALSPMIIAMIGAWFTEMITGTPCHEGNCIWMVLPWLCLLTIPGGFVFLIVYLVMGFTEYARIRKREKLDQF